MRRLVLYIACSLDGYIAKPYDDLSFLNHVQQEDEDYGYQNFVATVDTVIVGRKTYDWVLSQGYEFPHADKESYVITRTIQAPQGNITFYTGDIKDLVIGLKNQEGKHIFCDGGAEIVNMLLKEKLLDELIISVVPVLVGNGTRLFQEGLPEQELALAAVKHFPSGLVQLQYQANP
ncbi:dihydrofolate reductase family protein [Adhaeribacter rhizoryzae]|uniref:Dihydrofolate reductase n=1 Tax=Adhaeribacter rhizoryzae TaxID=2607907 RepID=A0A5M6D068_9BACT|nr:dihydrofolate reductase family protein [Adhaeribacter rhizoryzae]KAA5538939.1 dihydrofolate reductase [Adhaeribacter rhizoryzae]